MSVAAVEMATPAHDTQVRRGPPRNKPNAAVTSVTRIGQGLASCSQVPELQQHAAELQSVCFHGNNISRIEGLEKLTALRELNLSSNAITQVEGLQTLSNLTSLNLASNRLSGALGSLAGITSLTHLNLAYNGLTSLAGLADLQGPNSKLRILNVKQNLISSLQQLAVLAGCMGLRELHVSGNPISQLPNYRQAILNVLPHITQLDSLTGDPTLPANQLDISAAQAVAALKLQAYQLPASPPAQPVTTSLWQPSNALSAPGVGASPASGLQRVLSPPRGADSLADVAAQGRGAAASAPAGPSRNAASAANTASRRSARAGADSAGAGTAPSVQRVYLRDAAVQATDQSDKLMKRLRRECDQLKQELMTVTNELDERNRHEDDLRQQMNAAVQAVEDEAHRRVEEGYREASQAVQKALGEVDATRRAMSEVQERADTSARREEELKRQITTLEADLARLREESREQIDARKSEALSAAQALEAARQRAQDTETQLRQQIQAAERELSASKAALAAADQRSASLEAALQQANAVAVSLTQRMAESLSGSSTQVDGLKSRLATCEQSLTEATRREAELKAEVSMLARNISAMQQRHSEELTTARQRAHDDARQGVGSEVSAAEERARNAALASAQQDRAQLLEKLATLKAQLQYALKEGEKETTTLQEQLSQCQQQLGELQQAAQQSRAKQREHEDLVRDLSNLVSQQKTHIQGLQKERESLTTQLRAAGPEQVQRLAAEVGSLRTAAAEASIAKEQAEHSTKQWQEAERRLAELQATSARRCEELSQEKATLDAALQTARQDLKQSQAKVEALSAQLSSAEDAVKVKKAMLDSANDTIASLKAEVSDLTLELDDTRRAMEDTESAMQRQAEADAQEKANLRAEIEAGEAALEAMSTSTSTADARVAAAESRAREHEARAKALEKQLSDKDELIKYVEEEVERVKGLYEKREARLREERDAARTAASAAEAAQESLEGRLADQATKLDLTTADLQVEREAARSASQACQRAQEEAAQLAARLADTENELRSLFAAVERQKASSAVKMQQLAQLLSDMG